MDGTKALARLGLISLVAGTMAACGTGPVAGPAASMRIQQAGSQVMADDAAARAGGAEQGTVGRADEAAGRDDLPVLGEPLAAGQEADTDEGIQLKGELNEEQAKLYAKGFKDGYYDCARAHREAKARRKALMTEAKLGRYADLQRLGASDVYQPAAQEPVQEEPAQPAPEPDKVQVAEER